MVLGAILLLSTESAASLFNVTAPSAKSSVATERFRILLLSTALGASRAFVMPPVATLIVPVVVIPPGGEVWRPPFVPARTLVTVPPPPPTATHVGAPVV